MLSWIKKKRHAPQEAQTQQPIYHWADDEIPRYPPFMKGLPVVPPTKLLETQKELLDRIANTAIATTEVMARHYLPAIERFASFAHLLPASQSHHHRGAGGLLRHAIEVGLWALQSADRVLLQSAHTPAHRREMEPRWQLAVFLAAMCHDAGKPVTDLTVTNKDRSSTWNPITEDLYAWARRNEVTAYFLDWREGRARQHTALSSLIGERIIGADTLAWIAESETELVVWLMESLACNPSPTNLIHDLVVKADQTSVERDLRTLGVAMAGYDLGIPVERHLTDIMRRFVREGVWLVNEPGARLWNIGGNIYLVWPAAGEELAKQVREDGIPGIPRTPDGILDMLVERRIAFIREDAQAGDRYWQIAPQVLVEKIPAIKLPAIRLRDEAMVSSIPIPPVEGTLMNGQDAPDAAAPANEKAGGDTAPAEKGADAPNAAESATAPDTDAAQESEIEGSARVPSKRNQNEGGKKVTQRKPADDTSAEKSQPEAIDRPAIAAPSGGRSQVPQDADVKLEGAIGEALKALAQDLKAGDKKWGRDALVDADGQVLLKWPEAFSGYGLTAKAILDDLHGREWLWIDPMAPLKKVMDIEIDGEPAKAIRLVPCVSRAIVREAGGSVAQQKKKAEQPLHPMEWSPQEEAGQKPSEPEPAAPDRGEKSDKHSRKPTREKPKAPQSTKAQPPSEVPNVGAEREVQIQGADAPFPAGADQRPSETKGKAESPGMPSVDDVIAAIKDLPAQAEADGGWQLPKADVMAACEKSGLRVTHSRLSKLGQVDPSRFSVEGGMVRFCR